MALVIQAFRISVLQWHRLDQLQVRLDIEHATHAQPETDFHFRIKLTGPCEKDLKTFVSTCKKCELRFETSFDFQPIDKQRCFLTYESFNHNSDAVRLNWVPTSPVTVYKEIQLPDYSLEEITSMKVVRVCSQ